MVELFYTAAILVPRDDPIEEVKNDSHDAMFLRRIYHLQENSEWVFASVEIANTPAMSMPEINVGKHLTIRKIAGA